MRLNFNKITLLHCKLYCVVYLGNINPYTLMASPTLLHGTMQSHLSSAARSVTVDLDLFLCADALVDQEFENVASVVALQLDDVAPL